MSLCSCDSEVKNFGQPNCPGVLGLPGKLAFVFTKADDGTLNTVLNTDTIDDAFVSGKINETDKSKRWFVTGEINGVNDTRADNNTFELDGFQINSSKGVRTMALTVADGASPETAEAWESLGCRDMSFYDFTIDNQLGGNGKIKTELRPFRIKKKTMRATYQPFNKENETPPLVMISFDLHEFESDGDIAFISPGTGANDVQVDLLSFSGLIDIVMEPATSITLTSFSVPIDFIYGNHLDKDFAPGLVAADFTYEELTPTPGPVVITSVTEDTVNEEYDFVVPLAASTETFRLTFSKIGFEAEGTIDILIP